MKIRTLIATANNPYLALVSGGPQVLIVQHGEEADERSVIKMFLPGWWNVRNHWRKGKWLSWRGKKKSRWENERNEQGGGVTRQKMKRDIKEWELKEVRPITGFSVAFKDAWDRWQLQTILHHRAASSQEEIRDSSIPPPASPAPTRCLSTFPFPRRALWCSSLRVGSCRPRGLHERLNRWDARPANLSRPWLSGAQHFQVSLKPPGRVNPL